MARSWGHSATLLILALAAPAGLDTAAAPDEVPIALVVTDARGQLVRNLSAADFEISENGERRTVASVNPRTTSRRIVGLMLDEFHVSGESNDRVRASLATFVDTYLKPDDVVFVMKPLDPQTAIAPAASLEVVRERVASFAGRKGDYTPRSEFERAHISTSEPMASRQRAQVVRSGLEALAVAMRESREAAKALIVVTEGFASEQRDRVRAMTLRSTTRAAALSNIPVYVLDPSAAVSDAGAFNDAWQALAAQTGGALVRGAEELGRSLGRIGTDLAAQFVLRFQSSGRQDGGFHGLELKTRRAGMIVRAPTGYWAPFPTVAMPADLKTGTSLLTPEVSGLVDPWFRMSPGTEGRTRVTFLWTARGNRGAASVQFAALSFEGATVHEAAVLPAASRSANDAKQTSFEVAPGPLQISLAIDGATTRLGRDVRYIDVPRFDPHRPVIAAVEFIRPRSLPEFGTLQRRPDAVPTTAREFVRQDRLLVRVRAFAGVDPADVTVRLLNRSGQSLLDLPKLESVDGASQFDLPFARFARGDYRLEVRAAGAGQATTQILLVRLIG